MKFGDRLKELRTESGLTQEELANQLNLSKANVSKYESNSIEPNLDTLSLLSSLFEVSTDYLLGKSDFRTHLDEELSQEEFALYGEVRELTTAEKEKIMEFIKFTKSIRKNNE